MIHFEYIPTALTTLSRWMLWRYERRGDKTEKVPFNTQLVIASVTNPDNWASYDDIVIAFQRARHFVHGLNFILTARDRLVGIDLDDCRDPASGALTPEAAAIVDGINSYTEITPSGTGLRMFAYGTIPRGRKGKTVEIYSDRHALSITGNHLDGTPTTVEDRGEAITALYARMFPEKPEPEYRNGTGTPHTADAPHVGFPGTDAELITRAQQGPGGYEFHQLWEGEWSGGKYGSQSEADLAFCAMLGWWCGPQAERIDRLFRQSKLMRAKWDEKRGTKTYGEMTVERVVSSLTSWYRQGAQPEANAGPPRTFHLTELGNAERFVYQQGAVLRWVDAWKKWMLWDGTYWEKVSTNTILASARQLPREMAQEANARAEEEERTKQERAVDAKGKPRPFPSETLRSWALASETEKRIGAIERMTRSFVTLDTHAWNLDPWALNVANGTIDLRTGELRPHTATDYCTHLVPIPYSYWESAPRWEQFVLDIMSGDAELAGYLQRCVGYSLTGITREQIFFLLHGFGANGKSTFMSIVRQLFATYSQVTDFSTFSERKPEQPTNDLAALAGARLVEANEGDLTTQLSEAVVKKMTGDDPVSARFLFGEFFQYIPTYKIWLTTNHTPQIRGTDYAIWRRVRMIPFTRCFTGKKQDKELKGKLQAELPGVLSWAVRGCLEWQEKGLQTPQAVIDATRAYQEEEDQLGQFLNDHCEINELLSVSSSTLLKEFNERMNTKWSAVRFAKELKHRGFKKKPDGWGYMKWLGLSLKIARE